MNVIKMALNIYVCVSHPNCGLSNVVKKGMAHCPRPMDSDFTNKICKIAKSPLAHMHTCTHCPTPFQPNVIKCFGRMNF